MELQDLTIKQLRRLKGFTQKDIAKKLHISPTSYSNKEIGKTKFYFNEVLTLADVLEVPVDILKS